MLSRELAQRTLRISHMYSSMTRVRVLSWRGRHDEAAEILREWHPAFEETGRVERQIWYDEVMMRVAVAEGEETTQVRSTRSVRCSPMTVRSSCTRGGFFSRRAG